MTRQEYRDRLVERIATLIMTSSEYSGNYTKARYEARWIVDHSRRLGWRVSVLEKRR